MKSTLARMVPVFINLLLTFGPAPAEAQQPTQAQPDSLSVAIGVLQQRLQGAIEKKDYPTMESLTRTMTTLAPEWPDGHYNLACALAMQGKKDAAIESLTKAVALGFANAPLIETDADLASLRELPAFQASLAVAKRAYELATADKTPPSVPAPAGPGGATPAPLGPMPEVRARISGSTPLVTKRPDTAAGSKIGTKVKALWRNQWHPATIIGEQNGQYYIRYDSGSEDNNEWLTADKLSFPSTDGLPVAGDRVNVTWGGSFYESKVMKRDGMKWRIHYEGYPESSDEWVGLDRLRDMNRQPFAAPGAAAPGPMPDDGPANGIRDPGAPVPQFLPKPTPPAAANALDWVYIETKINPKEGAGWKFLPYRFMPDGIVARDYLHSTVEAFDFEARQKVDPAYYGVYQRSGDALHVTFASGVKRAFQWTDASPTPKLSGLTRTGKLRPGTPLNGKYVAESRLSINGKDTYSKSMAVWFGTDGSMRTTEDIFFAGGKLGASFGLRKEAPKEAVGTYSVDGWILSFTLNGRSDKSVIFAYNPEHDGAGAPTLDFMGIKWGLEE